METLLVQEKSARKFAIIFIVLFWGVPILLAGMNYVVNPLGYFNGLPLALPMTKAPQWYSSIRYHKAYDVWKYGAEYLVLGSSRAGFGLSNLNKYFDGRAYNNSVPGMQMYEILSSLEHAQSIKHLRGALVGLDFFAFNTHSAKFNGGFKPSRMLRLSMADDKERLLWRNLLSDVMDGLLSIDVFKRSLSRISSFQDGDKQGNNKSKNKGKKKEKLLDPDGGWGGGKANKYPVSIDEQIEHYKYIESMYLKNVWLAGSEFFDLYGNGSRLEMYRTMLRFSHENNINMKLFISPVHARLLVELQELGLWGCYEQWKRELWSINRDVALEYGQLPFELWDFAGVDEMTTEVIAKPEMLDWFVDSSHYSKRFGKMILEQLYRGENHGLGVRIDNEQILKERLLEVRSSLDEYRQNTEILDDIRDLISSVRKDLPQPTIGECVVSKSL